MSPEENRRRSARQAERRQRLESRLAEGRERQQQLEDEVSSILDEIELEENSISGTPVAGAVQEAASESPEVLRDDAGTPPASEAREAVPPSRPVAIDLLEQRISQLERQTPRPPPSIHSGSQGSFRNDRKFKPKPLFHKSFRSFSILVIRLRTSSSPSKEASPGALLTFLLL